MFRPRFALLGTLLVLAALLGACGGEPPEKEMQQAQGAIDAARVAGAPEYAKDEFDAAVKALEHAHQAATERDYRQALNDALDARDRAQTSVRMAADNMATARVEADRAVAAATASYDVIRTRLADMEAAKTPPRTLATARKTIEETALQLQEARTAFDQKHYGTATSTANAVSKAIIGIGAEIDGIAAPPPRRGR